MAKRPACARPRHTLMIMVDGVGIPPHSLEESIYANCPALTNLFRQHCVPIDACLEVPGIPQSATGQTSILTGVNAAKAAGSHCSGFPAPRLRELLKDYNIFTGVQRLGLTATFANAYVRLPDNPWPPRFQSATTVATLASLGGTRCQGELAKGKAVYHDLTRERLQKRLNSPPRVSVSRAADHLLSVARDVDFCLFEYFLTDIVAHRGEREDRIRALTMLDACLARLTACMDPTRELLVVTSDHGNIEDEENRHHTCNPVPLVAWGCGADDLLEACATLVHVTPALVNMLAGPASE